MAGVQVVLHEPDGGLENRKNETRNLGLQSIVHREDTLAGIAINSSINVKTLIDELTDLLDQVNSQIDLYIRISESIYRIMQNAYFADTTKSQQYIDILNQAQEFIK